MTFIYLTKTQIIQIHSWALEAFGGGEGLIHESIIDSAIAAPQMTFAGNELYPSLADKAAAIAFPIIHDHPFVDGNKRTGYLAADMFISLNGGLLECTLEDAEAVTLHVAAGEIAMGDFTTWMSSVIVVSSDYYSED